MSLKVDNHNDGRVNLNTFYLQAGPERCEHLSEAWRYS
jgi:hypothetical protein